MGSRSLPPQTFAEAGRIGLIAERDACLTCGAGNIQIHHLLAGGLRVGHRMTVGLCAKCHSTVKTRDFKRRWPDQALLNAQDDLIGFPHVTIPKGRREARAAGTMAKAKPFRKARRGPQTQRSTKTLPRRGL